MEIHGGLPNAPIIEVIVYVLAVHTQTINAHSVACIICLHDIYVMNHNRTSARAKCKVNCSSPPSNLIAGRPKAALLFRFFGGFRCGVPLFIVMLVIY